MSAVLVAQPAQHLPEWITQPLPGEVQAAGSVVAVYPSVRPHGNGGAALPVLRVVLKQPQPQQTAPTEYRRSGVLLHALIWLQTAATAEQASADAEAAKQRLLVHAHQRHGLVRLHGRSVKRFSVASLDLCLDAARLMGCVLQPQPQPAPVPRPLMGAAL
jgi:hypothetical protein